MREGECEGGVMGMKCEKCVKVRCVKCEGLTAHVLVHTHTHTHTHLGSSDLLQQLPEASQHSVK